MKSPHTGLKRIWYAGFYTWKGLLATWQAEAAFRQEVVLFTLMTPLAFWLGDNAVEVALLIGVLLIVLIVELLNSAIENVVDRIGDDYHLLSGRAKDQGSAAVFISFVVVVLVWGGFALAKFAGFS